MAINDILDLTVDVSATTDNFVKALQKAASDARLDLNVHDPMIKSFKAAQSDIKGIFAKTVSDAASAGLGRMSIQGFIQKLQPMTDKIETSMKSIFEMEVKLRKGGMDAAAKKQVETALAIERDHMQGLEKRLKFEKIATEKIIKRRKAATAEAERLAERTRSEAVEEVTEGLSEAFGKIKSGDFAGILKGAGKGLAGRGALMQERGMARSADGKAGGGMMQALGGFLTKLGPALAAIGAIAAGFAAVVAIALQADAAVKDLNRTMMSTGVSGKDLSDQYGRMGKTMTNISQGFMEAFSFNRLWGTTAKDHLEILGAYAEAGLTFREMTKGAKDINTQMVLLQKHTVAALTYSKLLGMSTAEISQSMATYMSDLGFTLEGVQAKFANIASAAKESGFATKRFFNMVLQATAGMSMYNVRLEEAAGLLMQLGKILGEKMGGDFIQELIKGFKSEDTETRIRKTMTTGVGYSLKVLNMDAIKATEEFRRKMADFAKDNKENANILNEAIEKAAPGATTGTPEEMVKKLSKLSQAEQGNLLARAKASKNPAMVRMLDDVMKKSVVARGGRGAAQAAREHAGMGATLLLQLNEAAAVLGTTVDKIDPANEVMRMAWEKITGKSGEEYQKLATAGKRFRGHQNVISEEQAKIKSEKDVDERQKLSDEFNRTLGQEFGVFLNDQGQRFKGKRAPGGEYDVHGSLQGTAMSDTLEDMLMSVGDELLGEEEDTKVSEDILLAQEIAHNTTDMAKILEQGVEWLLSKIYRSVEWIASFFGKGLNEDQKAAKGKASQTLQDSILEGRKQMQLQEREIVDLKRSLHGKSDDEKKAIRAEISSREDTVDILKVKAAAEEEQLRVVENIDDPKAVGRFGSPESSTSYLGLASSDKGVREVARGLIKEVTGGVDIEGMAWRAQEGKRQELSATLEDRVGSIATMQEGMAAGDAYLTPDVAAIRAELQAADQKEAAVAGQEERARWLASYGIGSGVQSRTIMGKEFGGTSTDPQSIKKLAKDNYIAQEKLGDKNAKTLSKKEMTEEERQKKKNADQIIDGIAKIEAEKEVKELAKLLATLGVPGDAKSLVSQAQTLIGDKQHQGKVPDGMDLNRKVIDPTTGNVRRLGDVLRSPGVPTSPGAAIEMTRRLGPTELGEAPPSKPATKDFLMHIGSDGQVKFAQRIDGADGVTAVATKGGGGVDTAARAARGGGGSGVTIVQHNYGDMEGVKKGWRTLMQARALN